jgi:hypothetical protein
MPDWTDLKPEAAACWKVFWKDDPLPLSVPLRAAALLPPLDGALDPDPDDPLPDELLLAGVELDEEHAARDMAIATMAPPTVMTCCLRRSCMTGFLLMGSYISGRE